MTAITAILPLLFLCALTLLPAGAASEGFEDLAVAASGKNPLMNPEFIDGGQGFNEKEHSYGLLVYDEDEDENQKLYPKYCSDAVPYWAEWKYDRAYAVNRIILRTANDSGQYSRRPNDGWTLSGSNDGASWEVLYTGAANDVEDVDYMYYRVDIPNNSKEFQYYRFEAGQTGGQIIQLAAVVLCEGEGPVVVASWKPKNFILEEGKTTIPATDFDAGADNYGKSGDPADGSKDFRPLEAVNTQAGGGAIEGNIGWISAGDWVQFTVRVIDEGRYSFAAWLASDAESPGNIAVYVDGEPVGESENSKRAGWQEYELYQVGEMEMEYGRHTIKTQFPTGGLNFGALEITRIGDIETPLPTQTGAEPGGKEEAPPENGASEIKASDEGGRSNLVLIIIVAAALAATIVAAVIYTAKNGGKNK
ncbi:MAG: carbohydrate-binding protein [Oscillospiraceae bacterium]|nr:carbohydrate-binding protein [Oscillospiraceae bacterium]